MQVSLSSKLAKFKRIALELYYRFPNAGFAEGETCKVQAHRA